MSRPHSGRSGAAAYDDGNASTKTKKGYKVVMEDVLQPKKNGKVMTSYRKGRPPAGYAYAEYGQGSIAARCLKVCKDRGLDIYEVYENHPNRVIDNDHVAHHLLRTGFHFPEHVVAEEARKYNLERERKREKAYKFGPIGQAVRRHNQRSSRQNKHHDDKELLKKQEEGMTRNVVLEIFPKIPKADLNHIVSRANKEGTVGTAANMKPLRRVQLAVGARIRHEHTHYDQLLKVVSYHDARKEIEPAVRAKIIEWRGEQDQGQELSELEETFREVIYIEDDDDDNDSAEHQPESANDTTEHESDCVSMPLARASQSEESGEASRDSSVEFLSEQPLSRLQGPSAPSYPNHFHPPRSVKTVIPQLHYGPYKQQPASRVPLEPRVVRGRVHDFDTADYDQPVAPWHPENHSNDYGEVEVIPRPDPRPHLNLPHPPQEGEISSYNPYPRNPLIENPMFRKQPRKIQREHFGQEDPREIVYQSIEGPSVRSSLKRRYSVTEMREDQRPLHAPDTFHLPFRR